MRQLKVADNQRNRYGCFVARHSVCSNSSHLAAMRTGITTGSGLIRTGYALNGQTLVSENCVGGGCRSVMGHESRASRHVNARPSHDDSPAATISVEPATTAAVRASCSSRQRTCPQ